jgi:tRNA uridine 5-carbamoylmethylation protein Kti12
MRVINIFGGPGAGKSTTAAGLFFEMKKRQIQVELVTEYAKDMTWEQRHNVLSDQLYILAKQNRRVQRLVGQVDWVITDSPLLLGLVYKTHGYFETFDDFVMEVFESYDNHNILISRDFEYQASGRNQTAEEAVEVDGVVKNMLDDYGVPYMKVTNDPLVDRTTQILNLIGLNSPVK